MGIDYWLTLAGSFPLDPLAEIAAPGAARIPTSSDRLLSFDLYEERGFLVSIRSGANGYYDAEDGGNTRWEWELAEYVQVSFHMDKDNMPDKGVPNVVATVAGVLAERAEDAALLLNSDWLLLTRRQGMLRKHNPSWWAHHGLDHLISWSTVAPQHRPLP